MNPDDEPKSDDAALTRTGSPLAVLARLTNPLTWAFAGTIGVLLGLAIGSAAASLSAIFLTVVIALFLALALDPLVRRLQGRGYTRGRSIGLTFAGLAVIVVTVLAFVVPATVEQVVAFAQAVPGYIAGIQQAPWFQSLTGSVGGRTAYTSTLAQLGSWLADPAHLLAVGTGILSLGSGLINGVSGTMIVLVLTLYFLGSLDGMKQALYRLLPAYRRDKAAEVTERITSAVGAFIGGGLQLSSLNAAFSFLLLMILGAPYAVMLAFTSFLITLIPMIGSVLFWVIGTAVCLLNSWTTAIIFAVAYFAYMQVEAYVITPRIMNKAVEVPGPLVLIGAMVGATLLGLLGALVAVPLTASLLILLNTLFIPRQDARTAPPATGS
ncbi:Putative transport protein YhhT [Propionicimonas sp. T2.31MG-18]|uniref:AI-2E family transporter n=1 Tax=Propionicimonas sp. T2.31MG-18 TaxID=3157620 RepID=UPI0035EB15B4